MSKKRRKFHVPSSPTIEEYPAPQVPNVRLSVGKDDQGWFVVSIKAKFRLTYRADDAWDAMRLLEELAGIDTCHLCGAPLYEIGGRLVCSRFLEHYPQPQSLLDRWVLRRFCPPVIIPGKSLHIRDNSGKINQWCKTHLRITTTKTSQLSYCWKRSRVHNSKLTITKIEILPPTKQEINQKRKEHEKKYGFDLGL